MKFTEEGFVRVNVSHDPARGLSISVEDSGIGISQENIDRIFDKFQQADRGVSHKYEGTGLGLYISSQFVEKMGGTLAVVASEPGKGSTFEVILPKELPLV